MIENNVLNNYYRDNDLQYHHSTYKKSGASKDLFVNHFHSRYEIMQLLKGKLECVIEGISYMVSEGDVLIINKNEHHSLTICSEVYERRVIEITDLYALNIPAGQYQIFTQFETRKLGINNLVPNSIVTTTKINSIFEEIDSCIRDTKYAAILFQANITLLMVELNRVLSQELNLYPYKNSNKIVEKTILYINEHLDKAISLDTLEEELNFSKYHIIHTFKKTMGIPLSRYIINKKILLAEKLILNGKSPMEACFLVGYNDYSNFYRHFKKILNKSPSFSKGGQIAHPQANTDNKS